mgnify:CR=1 FL=1
MEKLTWLLVAMGIAGVILNNHKDPRMGSSTPKTLRTLL